MSVRTEFDVRQEVLEAEARIRLHIRETPLEPSLWLSRAGSCEVYLKLENVQVTNSFKLRGASNKLLSLTDEERQRGIVTASTGNHGSAVAYLLRRFGWQGSIFVPENASPAKIEALRLLGADLRFHGTDGADTERFARRTAEETGRVYISPYNDPKIIGGQGTIAVELEQRLEGIDSVFVPVGGGGLVSGIAGYLKSADAQIEIIGCQPRRSAVMFESIKAGRVLDLESEPTLADGTAGGMDADTITYPVCRDRIDEFILVEEEEIAAAIRLILERHHLLIEGAAALAVASFLRVADRYKGRRVVLILTGSRISLEALRSVLAPGEQSG